MIQRIQTVWLLIAAILMAGVFYFPFYEMPNAEALTVGRNYLAVVLAGISIILSFLIIFNFKNRKRQLNLCWLNILSCVALLVWLFYSVDRQETTNAAAGNQSGHYWIGAFLPLISIIFLLMARSAIKKDHKLVQSMDRLRD